jgi:dual specificity phosphatase, catalytic domain
VVKYYYKNKKRKKLMNVVKVMSATDALASVWNGGVFRKNTSQGSDYVIVSITDEKDLEKIPIRFHPAKNLVGGLHLPFIDIPPSKIDPTKTVYEQYELDNNAFSKELACSLIEFIDKYKEEYPNINILVHCEAGVSRSQAIGAFLEIYLSQDYSNLHERLHDWNLEYFKVCLEALLDVTTDEELVYISESLLGYEKPIHKSAPMSETLWNPFDEIVLKKEKNDYLFSRGCRRSGPLYSDSDLIPLSNLLLIEELKERKLK